MMTSPTPVLPVLSRIQEITARFEPPARVDPARAATFQQTLADQLATIDSAASSATTSPAIGLDADGADVDASSAAQAALHNAGLCSCDRSGAAQNDGALDGVGRAVGGPAETADVTASGTGPISARPGWAGAAPFEAMFESAGAAHGVDPKLLASVARAESNFRPDARSSAGAVGLMQFMPATARSMGIDPMDPAQAIDGAARYLRRQLDRFGSPELAVAAYNAGPTAVSRSGGIPPYAETRSYVTKVLGSYRALS